MPTMTKINSGEIVNMSSSDDFPITKPPKLFTLMVVVKNDQVLLGLKKRGFGVGKWNGFGGKVEAGETVLHSAVRELQEECGLIARSLFKHGVVWFDNLENSSTISEVHIFTVDKFDGEISESDEMIPQWFEKNSVPFEGMWPSNAYWLPLVLEGKKFDAYFSFQDEREMIDCKIREYSH